MWPGWTVRVLLGGRLFGNLAVMHRPLHCLRVWSCCARWNPPANGRWNPPTNAGKVPKSRQLLPLCGHSGRMMSSQIRHPYSPSDPKNQWCVDTELYREMFHPFGVSTQQFNMLMGHGTRVKGVAGADVTKGGVQRKTVTLVIHGEAVAYHHGQRSQPECKYVGRIGNSLADGSVATDVAANVPTRGSVIGGSALVDTALAGQKYPFDIVAVTQIEWIEWDTAQLREFINSPRWHAVQASFYYMLYFELLKTLDKAKAANLVAAAKDDAKDAESVVRPPSRRQLAQLFIYIAVPFFAFGFADNAIMILCGDAIDANFCVIFGFSTLAAAGLGNWVSDVCGLGLGDAIERWAARLGLSDGKLTPRQQKMQTARLVTSISKIVGISLGCFAGMVPLLFRTPRKIEFSQNELEIYDKVFSPSGVTTNQYAELMEKGTINKVQAGGMILHGGRPCNKVILILHGEAAAYAHTEGTSAVRGQRSAIHLYSGRMDEKVSVLQKQGSVIGGAALADPSITSQHCPYDVIASGNVEWIEWMRQDLQQLMEAEPAICASLYSLLYKELHLSMTGNDTSKRLDQYRGFLAAVLVDGHLNATERKFIADHMERLQVSEEEHIMILAEHGWTPQDWENGLRTGTKDVQLATLETGIQQIQSVVQMMESTIRQLHVEGK